MCIREFTLGVPITTQKFVISSVARHHAPMLILADRIERFARRTLQPTLSTSRCSLGDAVLAGTGCYSVAIETQLRSCRCF